MELALGLVIGVLMSAGLAWGARQWRRRGEESVPHVRVGSLLGAEEKRFFDIARRALAPDFEIFAKVSLADVVRPSPSVSAALRRGALDRLRVEHADFVVCTPDNGQILGVVEFSTGEAGHHGNQEFFDAVLERSGVPVLRVEQRNQYEPQALREQALATFRPPVRAAAMRMLVRRGTVWLRVDGHGTFQNSAPLRAYTEQMFEAGHRSFAFDLQGCDMMDSTFLGTLTGLALRLREDPRGRVGFARVNAKVESLFERYGLDRVLAFQGFEAAPPAPGEMEELALATTKEYKRGTMVEAHEALAAASPENEERFREALEFLKRKEPENG